MTEPQDDGSLADRAAAWVPPWQRAVLPTEPGPTPSPEPPSPADGELVDGLLDLVGYEHTEPSLTVPDRIPDPDPPTEPVASADTGVADPPAPAAGDPDPPVVGASPVPDGATVAAPRPGLGTEVRAAVRTELAAEDLAGRAAAWVPPWERETPGPAATARVPVAVPTVELGSGDAAVSAEPVVSGSEPAVPESGSAVPAVELGSGSAPAVPGASGSVVPAVAVEEAGSPVDASAGTVAVAALAGTVGPERAARGTDGVPRQKVSGSNLATDPLAGSAVLDPAELRAALEAILLVVDEPVNEILLAQVLEQPTDRVFDALVDLAESYTARGCGFELRRAAGGWRLYTREAYAPYVERFILDGQSVRLTQAALETLAVVAYRQPVTRSRISAIRGVNCDGVVRTLVNRGLIEECGAEPESGAHLYRTTSLFLEKLGLDALDQLPPLAPFLPDDVEELSDAQV
jgi:segregation and condensation protein B